MAKKNEEEIEEAVTEDPNEKRAQEIFAAMPHIHTIWFDDKGEFRFYETPGSYAIHKIN